MSKLSQYKDIQQQIEQMKKNLKSLEADPQLERELELESKLRELMREYGKSEVDIIAILDPNAAQAVKNGNRKARRAKRYINPHTDEVVETKGGNHKLLKQWKDQYGADTVESWLDLS